MSEVSYTPKIQGGESAVACNRESPPGTALNTPSIHRKHVVITEVTIPEGCVVCPSCEGKGLVSKYDEGWRSIVHSSELAALRPCFTCTGVGYVPEKKS